MDQTVQEAKRYGVYTCRPSTLLWSVARSMVDEEISALVVVDDEGYLCGVISRMDLLRAQDQADDWPNHTVEQWMISEVVTARPDDRLKQVAHKMIQNQIHRVVIVYEEEGRLRPLSVVSTADLLYHLSKERPIAV